jgi:hypothetical protein
MAYLRAFRDKTKFGLISAIAKSDGVELRFPQRPQKWVGSINGVGAGFSSRANFGFVKIGQRKVAPSELPSLLRALKLRHCDKSRLGRIAPMNVKLRLIARLKVEPCNLKSF